jgi:hypothetical protein
VKSKKKWKRGKKRKESGKRVFGWNQREKEKKKSFSKFFKLAKIKKKS